MKLALSNWPEAGVVDGVFHQRLADALHRAAMHLAREQQRIERGAEIVDHDVVDDRGCAGLGIDLDFGDMRAVRICRRLDAELVRRAQFLGVARGCAARSANEIARSVPATRTVPSAISRSLADASSASAAISLSCSASVLVARSTETPPTGIELDPPVPAPVAIAIGIALHDAHALRRQIEPLGDQLRIGGGVALPGRLRADQHGDAAVAIEPHGRGFRPVVAAGLDIGRNADAAQLAGALGLRRRAC